MANSPLARTGEQTPEVGIGHGTSALGPSDSSDSGSDVQGGEGFSGDMLLDLGGGTTSDLDQAKGASLDLGDANLDSDTDASGTGERAAAGRDSAAIDGADISPDQIIGSDGLGDIASDSALVDDGLNDEALDAGLDDADIDADALDETVRR